MIASRIARNSLIWFSCSLPGTLAVTFRGSSRPYHTSLPALTSAVPLWTHEPSGETTSFVVIRCGFPVEISSSVVASTSPTMSVKILIGPFSIRLVPPRVYLYSVLGVLRSPYHVPALISMGLKQDVDERQTWDNTDQYTRAGGTCSRGKRKRGMYIKQHNGRRCKGMADMWRRTPIQSFGVLT